jgi:hypothetical protein
VCGVHERQHTGQIVSQVMAAFRERFNKAPPRRATLLDWKKRAFVVGSVKDRTRSGRKTVSPKMFRRMSQRTWRRTRLCVQHQGAHTDSQDI